MDGVMYMIKGDPTDSMKKRMPRPSVWRSAHEKIIWLRHPDLIFPSNPQTICGLVYCRICEQTVGEKNELVVKISSTNNNGALKPSVFILWRIRDSNTVRLFSELEKIQPPNQQSAINKPSELRTPTGKFRIHEDQVKWIDVIAQWGHALGRPTHFHLNFYRCMSPNSAQKLVQWNSFKLEIGISIPISGVQSNAV